MTRRLYVAYFEEEERILAATRAAREAGLPLHDVFTPYAVHGMDEAMGLRPSRLTWVCFGAALVGLAAGLGLQYYASAVSWPINVGGKPFNSFPAFIPVAFELTVLSAALVTVAALLLRTRLRPRAQGHALPRVTDDRFALAFSTDRSGFNEARAARLSALHGAVESRYEEVSR
jgi:hypothetical protein